MTRPIILTEAAREDIESTRRWYRARSGVLRRDFVRSLRTCIEAIERFPEGHPVVHRDVCRALLRRFPYMLLYVVRESAILIVGCMHTRREPRRWQDRLE